MSHIIVLVPAVATSLACLPILTAPSLCACFVDETAFAIGVQSIVWEELNNYGDHIVDHVASIVRWRSRQLWLVTIIGTCKIIFTLQASFLLQSLHGLAGHNGAP